MFFLLYHNQDFLPDLYMSNTVGVLKAGTVYPSHSPAAILWCLCYSSFRFFCVVLLCVFTFYVLRCDVHYDCSVRIYLQMFVWGCMSYLHCLSLYVYSGIQHISSCVLLCFSSCCVSYVASFSGLSPFLIAPSVFSDVYLMYIL
jgi:uncharacterized membrane protein YesL